MMNNGKEYDMVASVREEFTKTMTVEVDEVMVKWVVVIKLGSGWDSGPANFTQPG